jgi:hypothetical protein
MLGAIVATGALSLVFAGTALADHGNGGGNGNGCNAPGHAYGHDNCDPPADPPPSGEDQAPPTSDAPEPPSAPAGEEPSPGTGSTDGASQSAPPPDAANLPQTDASSDSLVPTVSSAPEAGAPSSSPPDSPPPYPGPPVAGWAPVVARSEAPPAPPAPQPTAPRGRTFSSYSGPDASWGEPDASWSQGSAERFGVTGTSAIIAIRRGAGVAGGVAFRVQMVGRSTFSFRASRSIVAGAGGRLYRIGAWLRSDVPGLTVCLRIQEVSPADPLTAVRTSESCLSPTTKWKRFRHFRRTLASRNKLIFSIYSYGAVTGDSFEVDRFTVSRRVKNGWKRVDAAFGDASELR